MAGIKTNIPPANQFERVTAEAMRSYLERLIVLIPDNVAPRSRIVWLSENTGVQRDSLVRYLKMFQLFGMIGKSTHQGSR